MLVMILQTWIKDNKLQTKQMQISLDIPIQSSMLIAKNAFDMFKSNYQWENNIRSVTVRAINLVNDDISYQTDLFTNIRQFEREERLDACIDKIRAKFGKNCIKNGILLQDIKMPKLKPEITMPSGMLKA